MKLKGPIITLMAGLVVAGSLFGMSFAAANQESGSIATSPAGNAEAVSSSAAAPAPSPSAAPQAPVDPAPAGPVTYAGKVSNKTATLAIAVRDGKAVAYLCNGRNLEAWLQGTAENGQLNLTAVTAGEATLTGTYDANGAAGTATVNGKPYEFRIKAVQAPSGLYRIATTVSNARYTGGWIEVDGQTVGMVTREGGPGEPAPARNPDTGEVRINGQTVQTDRVDGTPIR